jgi:hypothetical protein
MTGRGIRLQGPPAAMVVGRPGGIYHAAAALRSRAWQRYVVAVRIELRAARIQSARSFLCK